MDTFVGNLRSIDTTRSPFPTNECQIEAFRSPDVLDSHFRAGKVEPFGYGKAYCDADEQVEMHYCEKSGLECASSAARTHASPWCVLGTDTVNKLQLIMIAI